jgi:hypothetical protein
VTEETYSKCIKPEGEFKGKRVGPKDIIHLQTGGTGFAARDGEKAQVKKHFSLGECAGCRAAMVCVRVFFGGGHVCHMLCVRAECHGGGGEGGGHVCRMTAVAWCCTSLGCCLACA